MNNFENIFVTTTDTILGIGAPISSKNKKLIYTLKNRPLNKPLIIMVGSLEQARKFKEWTPKAEEIAQHVWPGQVTLVLNKTLSLRMPNKQKLQELIIKIGPVYMTSANKSGEKPYSLKKAREVFKEISNFYNFGPGSGKESIIIDVQTGKVLR